jgi:hypothetical protein
MRTVYRALAVSFISVAGVSLLAWLVGHLLRDRVGPCPQTTYQQLQCAGVAILLWATLAKQGWNIQTWGGNSAAERVDLWVFWVLYLAGSFVLMLSVAWPTQ